VVPSDQVLVASSSSTSAAPAGRRRPDVADEAQRLAAELVVQEQLRQAEDEQEVEHPRARDAVDARERAEQRARTSRARLRVDLLRVRQGHVRLGRQAERLRDLDVGDVRAAGPRSRHRRARDLHVERRRARRRRARARRPDDWAMVIPAEDVDVWKTGRPDDRHRRDQAHEA
jgi:hypothetical protein